MEKKTKLGNLLKVQFEINGMMITVKNTQTNEVKTEQIMKGILSQPISIVTKARLRRFSEEIEKEKELFQKMRTELQEKYGKKNDKGDYEYEEGQEELFKKEELELLEQEIIIKTDLSGITDKDLDVKTEEEYSELLKLFI